MSVISGLAVWGNDIASILNTWADMGIFAYALPFLLIFAVVFGILSATRMFGENKGVNAVVALAVGLMALQFDYVPTFFATIFPYAGVGIGVLLVALILMGLFVTGNEKGWFIAFFIIGAVIALIVILSSLASYEWWGGNWWYEYWPAIVALLVIGGLVATVIAATKKSGDGSPKGSTPFSMIPWRGNS